MDPQDSPFKPGARCALRSGYNGDTYTEVFVDRVHKSGNFTLRDRGSQQWRPFESGSSWRNEKPTRWYADETGRDNCRSRERVLLWDATTDAEITAAREKQRLADRLAAIWKRIERLRLSDVNDAMLNTLEGALPPTAPDVEKSC